MAGKFELKKSKNEQYFFSLLAANGQTILSSEMYDAKASAVAGIESVKKNAADDAMYVRLDGKDGSPYFTLRAGNNQVIGQSQMYSSASARDNGIESCKTNGPGATTSDLS
ncbi:MAG: YegP family protein [Polaromonas sp.]|uniref:YegP family protein n=1 Tax=Polaromonas sp. TaxID=1869339 RepID=UPI0017F0E684|nr:YegP family protein [Polaromonas sp.]MBA3593028.1 YegP family protein [Polaromonas sp.]